MADEYDDMSDEEQGIQHINDDDIGCYGYGYSSSGVSKFTTVLIDNIFPTAKTSIIGKEVGEFELLTSSSVWKLKKVVIHSDIENFYDLLFEGASVMSRCQKAQSYFYVGVWWDDLMMLKAKVSYTFFWNVLTSSVVTMFAPTKGPLTFPFFE